MATELGVLVLTKFMMIQIQVWCNDSSQKYGCNTENIKKTRRTRKSYIHLSGVLVGWFEVYMLVCWR